MKKILCCLATTFCLLLVGCANNKENNSSSNDNQDEPIIIDDGYRTVTFDTKGGSKIDPQRILLGEKVIKPSDPIKEGHSFVTWTYDLEPWDFDNDVVASDMILEAQYNANQYELSLSHYNNEAHGTITGSGTYTYGSSVVLDAVPDKGYSFVGWYKNEYKMISPDSTYVYTMGLDQTLYARWSPNLNNLSVISENENEGTVSLINGNGYTGESITVRATPKDGCSFVGWYNQSAELSTEELYTFVMPSTDFVLVGKFISDDVVLQREIGMIPVVSNDHKTLTYGTYPQNKVEDESLIAILDSLSDPEENGWYKHEGRYYAKINQSEWYSCTSVKWSIKSYSGNVYNALCDMCFYKCKYSQRNDALQYIYNNVFNLDNSAINDISNLAYYSRTELNSLSIEERKCDISQYTSAKYGGTSYWSGYSESSGMNVHGDSWHYYNYITINASTGQSSESGGTSTTPANYSATYLNCPSAVFTIN